jgi:hypothetical protein
MDWEVRLGLGLLLGGVIASLSLILHELKGIAGTLKAILWRLNNPPPPPPPL